MLWNYYRSTLDSRHKTVPYSIREVTFAILYVLDVSEYHMTFANIVAIEGIIKLLKRSN